MSKVKSWWCSWAGHKADSNDSPYIVRTKKCYLAFQHILKEDRIIIFGLMILTRSLSRSKLGHFLELRHLDFFALNIPTFLTWVHSKKLSNNECYLISTLWNFLYPSKIEESKRWMWMWIKCCIFGTGNIRGGGSQLRHFCKTDPPNLKLTFLDLSLFRKCSCLSLMCFRNGSDSCANQWHTENETIKQPSI